MSTSPNGHDADSELTEPDRVTPDGQQATERYTDSDPADSDDFAAYLASVEAAAARSRAELRSDASPRRVAAALGATAAVAMASGPPNRVAGGRGGIHRPRGRTARGRPEKPRDNRPLLRRPRTWFLLLAMIPVIAAIVALFYFGNLLKAGYDAYNNINVPRNVDRPVFTINSQGTPVVVPTEQAQAQIPNWDNKDPFNILLLGIDPRPTDVDPPRSDTMIVVHVDPATQQVTMMSIPRDLWVTIPGYGQDKINAAYPYGELNPGAVPGNCTQYCGATLAQQTVEANFGITINYFVTVDFEGFRKIVDTVGGIVIDVPAPIKDDQYPAENLGMKRILFKTGLQRMNGEQALQYARTRHDDNDIARGNRQQQVLLAIRQQAVSRDLIFNIDTLLADAGSTVRTDLNFDQMRRLANLGRQIDASKIAKVNLWEVGVLQEHTPQFAGDAFYLAGDWPAIYNLMNQYFRDAPATASGDGANGPGATPNGGVVDPTAAAGATATRASLANVDFNATIVVQNAAAIDLLATSAVQLLRTVGFNDAIPDTATQAATTTVIYDNTNNPATARYVAQTLGVPESSIVTINDSQAAAVLVVLGADANTDVIFGGARSP